MPFMMTDYKIMAASFLLISLVLGIASGRASSGRRRGDSFRPAVSVPFTSFTYVSVDFSRLLTPTVWKHLKRAGPLLYFLGIPYAALLVGAIPPSFIGLTGLEHFHALSSPGDAVRAAGLMLADMLPFVGNVVGVGVVFLALQLVVWGVYALALRDSGDLSPSARPSVSFYRVLLDAVHWAFYRGLAWLLTGDLYLGAVLGVLLVLAEWASDRRYRVGIAHPDLADTSLLRLNLLLVTSTVFVFAPDLWLLLPLHLLLSLVPGIFFPALRRYA